MRVIGLPLLVKFYTKHPVSKGWLDNWIADARAAQWSKPQDIKNRYSSASFLPQNIVIFNVCGNKYRLEVTIAYQVKTVVIGWIGTHADYSRRGKP